MTRRYLATLIFHIIIFPESFCMANAPDIPNARKHYANCDNPTYQCDDYAIILYTCKSGFEFPDGSTYKRVRCTCDYKEFKRQIPADGCRREYRTFQLPICYKNARFPRCLSLSSIFVVSGFTWKARHSRLYGTPNV